MELSPEADQLQFTYLSAFLLGSAGDSLKGPYLYALYDSYHISHQTIELLYVVASISSLCVGTFVASLADTLGRRRACLLCVFLFALAYATQNFQQLPILFIGRILSGIAVSFYHTAFECWLIQEHRLRELDSPSLTYIFRNAHIGNALVAVLAGLQSESIVQRFGYRAPFNVGIGIFILMSIVILTTWSENYGTQPLTKRSTITFLPALRVLRNSPRIIMLGLCSALFEGALFIFAIEWTPSLKLAHENLIVSFKDPPFGLIFAIFMLMVMFGAYVSALIVEKTKCDVELLMIITFGLAMLSLTTPILYPHSQLLVLISFLVFEFCVGVYWPAIGIIRSRYIPDEIRSTLMSYFRVPQNLITLAVLIAPLQLSVVYICCVILLCLATMSMITLYYSIPCDTNDGSEIEDETLTCLMDDDHNEIV